MPKGTAVGHSLCLGQGEALFICSDPHIVNSGLQMSFYAFIALTWFPISTDGRGGLQKVISVLHLAKLENINFLQTSRPRLKKVHSKDLHHIAGMHSFYIYTQ